MKKDLFPYYRVYVCWKGLVPALLLLLLVGGAVIWYHMGARDVPVEEYREAAFIVIFVIMFLYTGISTVLFRGNVISLDVQQKEVVEKWESEMFLANARAFIIVRKVLKKVVDADGYEDEDVRTYYTEKWNEIKKAIPSK